MIRATAILVFIGFFALDSVARADDTSVVVCGAPVTTLTKPSLKAFENPGPPSGPNFSALRTLLATNSTKWPPSLSTSMSGALSGLEQGTLASKAFEVHSTGEIQKEQKAFEGTPYLISLPIKADAPDCGDQAAARRDAASFIMLVESVLADTNLHQYKLTATQMGVLEAQYDKYLFDGFPMFPWEAAVNSWFLTPQSIAGGPPHNAIVLVHPAAGLVGTVSSGSKSDVGGSLSIEPIGWIHYSSDYKQWYGASLLAVFASDRNAGYGVAVNYNNYKLGVTWNSDRSGGHNGATLFIGMDLLQFIGKEHRAYSAYMTKVRDAAAKID